MSFISLVCMQGLLPFALNTCQLQASALPLEPYLLHQSIQSQFHWWRNGSHLFEQPRMVYAFYGNEENPMLVSWRCLMCDFFHVLKNEKLHLHHNDEV